MFKKLVEWFEPMGYAIAASRLAQQGYTELAKRMMTEHHKLKELKEAKATVKELRSLSDRELDDIGISRYDINVQGVMNNNMRKVA